MDSRLRALADLAVSWSREDCGRHEYDGIVQDLSPDGVARGLEKLGGEPYADPYDEAVTNTHEHAARVAFGDLELHRRNLMPHLQNLDVSCYQRAYAPQHKRNEARESHLAQWPTAVDGAIESLDELPAPTAAALLNSVRGLAADLDPEIPVHKSALKAHRRLVKHVECAAEFGDPSAALGAGGLAALLGSTEGLTVDLGELAVSGAAETSRLRTMLKTACRRIDPNKPVAEIIAKLHTDHPTTQNLITTVSALTTEVLAWIAQTNLVPYVDGVCEVAIAPPSRRAGSAALTWAGPFEADNPSTFWVTPPDSQDTLQQQKEWMSLFSPTILPAVTVHEVAPGHFSHSRAMRRLSSDPRRLLHSMAFVEGWAHYGEELMLEEGFREEDPRFAVGVALEGLVRCTRLVSAIGVHTGEFDVAEATRRFMVDAYLTEPAAAAEARRATYDPTYGRYTWGKLLIRQLREDARTSWGAEFSLARFHRELLALGSPPLGLMTTMLR